MIKEIFDFEHSPGKRLNCAGCHRKKVDVRCIPVFLKHVTSNTINNKCTKASYNFIRCYDCIDETPISDKAKKYIKAFFHTSPQGIKNER